MTLYLLSRLLFEDIFFIGGGGGGGGFYPRVRGFWENVRLFYFPPAHFLERKLARAH